MSTSATPPPNHRHRTALYRKTPTRRRTLTGRTHAIPQHGRTCVAPIGVARSSEEAEDLLDQERPDVIIMDVYLKGPRTGLELAQQIHATDPIPILFLTASTKPEVLDAIRALKGARYLAKPISSDGLTDMLEQLLRADVAH